MVWSNGSYYKGRFMKGKANGLGIFVLPSGTYYKGQFKDDKIILG